MSEQQRALEDGRVPGAEYSALAGPERLLGLEAPGRAISETPDDRPLEARAVGVRAVLEQQQAPAVAQGAQCVKLGGLSPHVRGHDGLGLAGDGCLGHIRGDGSVAGTVHEYRSGAQMDQWRNSREESIIRADDLVARADAGAVVEGMQGGGAGGSSNGARNADVLGERVLEVPDDPTSVVYRNPLMSLRDKRGG